MKSNNKTWTKPLVLGSTLAVLGALGQGDIGSFFPPSEPQWKDAPSRIFLEKAAELVAEANG